MDEEQGMGKSLEQQLIDVIKGGKIRYDEVFYGRTGMFSLPFFVERNPVGNVYLAIVDDMLQIYIEHAAIQLPPELMTAVSMELNKISGIEEYHFVGDFILTVIRIEEKYRFAMVTKRHYIPEKKELMKIIFGGLKLAAHVAKSMVKDNIKKMCNKMGFDVDIRATSSSMVNTLAGANDMYTAEAEGVPDETAAREEKIEKVKKKSTGDSKKAQDDLRAKALKAFSNDNDAKN